MLKYSGKWEKIIHNFQIVLTSEYHCKCSMVLRYQCVSRGVTNSIFLKKNVFYRYLIENISTYEKNVEEIQPIVIEYSHLLILYSFFIKSEVMEQNIRR